MIGFLAIEMSILKCSDNSLINMNTIQATKKCTQIDFSEYTLFLNTLVKFEFYLSFLDGAEEPNISNKPTIILPKSIPLVEIRTSLQIKGLPNRNLNNGKVIMTPMA